MIVAGTGHRPDKLGGYSKHAFDILTSTAMDFILEFRPPCIISGMALGWDQALAMAAVKTNTFWIAAVPFVGQESAWPEQSQEFYRQLIKRANEVVIVSSGIYSPDKMQIRNQWMVDNCDLLLALWDGSPGGTKNCLMYADYKERITINLYQEYENIRTRVGI